MQHALPIASYQTLMNGSAWWKIRSDWLLVVKLLDFDYWKCGFLLVGVLCIPSFLWICLYYPSNVNMIYVRLPFKKQEQNPITVKWLRVQHGFYVWELRCKAACLGLWLRCYWHPAGTLVAAFLSHVPVKVWWTNSMMPLVCNELVLLNGSNAKWPFHGLLVTDLYVWIIGCYIFFSSRNCIQVTIPLQYDCLLART